MQALRMLLFSITGVIIVFSLTGCETTGSTKETADKSTEVQASAEDISGLLTDEIPKISGPKRTVAVGKFDAVGSFTANYGDWDIGGGLSAMLTTALAESNRFIVIERANLNQILSEQELKGSKLLDQKTGPALGKLTGVNFLIFGSVTEFGAEDKGGGFGLGFAGGGLPFTTGLSRQSKSGSVAIDVRIVDTTTGRIVDTARVKEKIKSSGWDVSGGYQGISLGTNQFNKTPLGEASRRAITKIVHYIARKAEKTAWTGRVVDIGDDEVIYINAGANTGIQVGDFFMIERVTKILTDPETGEVLSERKKAVGSVQITTVEEKLAYGPYSSEGQESPKRGDLVVKRK